MALCPEVQRKAQAEVDAIVGKDRLPNFLDRESLPYVNAIVKELLRWNPSVPLGIYWRAPQYILIFNTAPNRTAP